MRINVPVLPNVSAEAEAHADWLELNTLVGPQRVEWTAYERDLRVGGTADGFDEPRWEDSELLSESLERLVNDVVAELTDRVLGCGSDVNRYPFEIGQEGIMHAPSSDGAVYSFLLLLSNFGKDAGPPGTYGDRLFEELCAEALRSYLGNRPGETGSFVFGFPRKRELAQFSNAVDELCRRVGEGSGHQSRPTSKNQKDAKLDIVGWRGFPDRKSSQIIAFGQCATGGNWNTKLNELQPSGWCRKWMREHPVVLPLRTFFIPHRIDPSIWNDVSIDAGILFDRCRISWLVRELGEPLQQQLREWSQFVITERWRR